MGVKTEMGKQRIIFDDNDKIGRVENVTSSKIIITLDDNGVNNNVVVNDLIAISTKNKLEYTIATVTDVRKTYMSSTLSIGEVEDSEATLDSPELKSEEYVLNQIEATFLGSLSVISGNKITVFKRGIKSYPALGNGVYKFSSANLTKFMESISDNSDVSKLSIGKYALDSTSRANLNGDKFFQRHAAILGSTGSGKSWLVSKLLEEASNLKFSNIIVFDIHGEYKNLSKQEGGFGKFLKIAGPSDTQINDCNLFLPYWLLNREEIQAILLDRNDNDAPNQANRFNYHLLDLKKRAIKKDLVTVDSPVPYSLSELISLLIKDDEEMVQGKSSLKKGPWNGKLTRFIARLQTKVDDKRYSFMFSPPQETEKSDWAISFFKQLLEIPDNLDTGNGIKIIDFSEVPSDVLPIVTGTIGRLLFDIQSWILPEKRTPISIICDEAHLYLPTNESVSAREKQSLKAYERIAKEGRKYALSLVVVSQRPSDLNRTILSQCNNFIVLRLTNGNDQATVKHLLPDSMGQLLDQLPLLNTGESIVIGDSVIMPTKILLDKPKFEPNSKTHKFWNEWEVQNFNLEVLSEAIENMRSQTFLKNE